MMLLEASVHRIGGHDGLRQFGPHPMELSRTAIERRPLDASRDSRTWITLQFSDWTEVDDEWLSCRVDLMHLDGSLIGARPVLIYREPYDIPTHALFRPRWTEAGTFTLGLRMLAAA